MTAPLRNCSGTAAHVERQSDCLQNFLARRPVLVRYLGVVGDATIAMNGNADSQRHKLFGLRI